MPEKTFKMVTSGLFTSLVSYCIEVFGNNWGLDTMDETERRSISFIKKDCAKLQTLQNTVLKLQTGLPRDYPTKDLLLKTENLSIHQQIAYQTLVQVFKAIINQKPHYISNKLIIRKPEQNKIFPLRQINTVLTTKKNLSLSRGGFMYRGQTLWNLLPTSLRFCVKIKDFKVQVRKWVLDNISIKPS